MDTRYKACKGLGDFKDVYLFERLLIEKRLGICVVCVMCMSMCICDVMVEGAPQGVWGPVEQSWGVWKEAPLRSCSMHMGRQAWG